MVAKRAFYTCLCDNCHTVSFRILAQFCKWKQICSLKHVFSNTEYNDLLLLEISIFNK